MEGPKEHGRGVKFPWRLEPQDTGTQCRTSDRGPSFHFVSIPSEVIIREGVFRGRV